MEPSSTVQDAEPRPAATPATGRLRRWVAAVLAVLAVLVTVSSLLMVWTFRTLTDTELFVDRVAVIIEDPAVAQAVSDQAAQQLVAGLDVAGRLQQVLPPDAASLLAAPISAGLERSISEGSAALLQSDRFQQAWRSSLAITHDLLIGVLSGDNDNAQTSDGDIVIDITPVINALVGEAAQGLGDFLGRDITPPPITSDSIDEAVGELNAALGTELPADIGTITVAKPDDLATAQSWYAGIRSLVWLSPIAALVLVALALLVATRRIRTLLWIVLGAALLLLFVGLLTEPLQQALLNAVADNGLRDAIAQAYTTILSSLMTGIAIAVALGIIAALGLFLTGESRAAARGRELAAQTPSLAARHRSAFLVTGAAVSLLVLALLPGSGWGQVLFVCGLYGLYVLGVLLAPMLQARERADHAAR